MELEEAQEVFNKILELCYDSANEKLIEIAESVYPDVEAAEDTLDVIGACTEIQLAINNEIDVYPDEEEFVLEILDLIDLMSE